MPEYIDCRCSELVGRHVCVVRIIRDTRIERSYQPLEHVSEEERDRTKQFLCHNGLSEIDFYFALENFDGRTGHEDMIGLLVPTQC